VANQRKPAVEQGDKSDLEHLKQRMDLLDQRLDNIDSVMTAVVERLMASRVSLNATCPNCGKNMEITIVGSVKPTL
jgi:hypothetical protein